MAQLKPLVSLQEPSRSPTTGHIPLQIQQSATRDSPHGIKRGLDTWSVAPLRRQGVVFAYIGASRYCALVSGV